MQNIYKTLDDSELFAEFFNRYPPVLVGKDFSYREIDGQPVAIDKRTGEITTAEIALSIQGSLHLTPEQLKRKEQQKEYFRKKDHSSNFLFISKESRFKGIAPATIARLIYLSTFLYFGTDCLYVTERTPMRVSDLPHILRISKATAYRFLGEVPEEYLWCDDIGNLHLLKDVFTLGRLSKKQKEEPHIRAYCEAIRNLYMTNRNHRQLGYVFLMLPYINVQYNILCWNPMERDISKVMHLTVRDFCKLTGQDYMTAHRLMDAYSEIEFDVGDHRELFCAFVRRGRDLDDTHIFVNPNILYSGDCPGDVKILATFCKSPNRIDNFETA